MTDPKPKLDLKLMILTRNADGDPGSVWTAADFFDLGTRDAIDKVLQRLVKNSQLRRIDRGLYDTPRHNSLTQQSSPPEPRQVIEAVIRRDQIRVLVDGMTAANDLNLSNAVPAKIVVHIDARLKPIHFGNLQITFKPTAASKLIGRGARRGYASRSVHRRPIASAPRPRTPKRTSGSVGRLTPCSTALPMVIACCSREAHRFPNDWLDYGDAIPPSG